MVHCELGYLFNGILCIGKEIGTLAPTKELAVKIVEKLSVDLLNAGRNIMADKDFTDFEHAEELLINGITYVGTVRKKKETFQNHS